jgi:bifunctional UDP-N-acetylglucosamine pyrophosphorylase/glucosamine-1-phosphate N-acetyltransferase
MQVVILAAGESSRFIPFRERFSHKSLVSIMGKTILEHTLLSVKKAGITDVILVVNEEETFKKVIADMHIGLSIKIVVFPKAHGMGKALLAARNFIKGPFFLINAYRIEFDVFAKEMIKIQKTEDTVVLLGKNDNHVDKYGYLQFEKEKVISVVEKPKILPPMSLRIIGMYLLTKQFITILDKTPDEHYNFEAALSMFAKDHDMRFLETEKETVTLKYGWDLFHIKDFLLKNVSSFISPKANIAKHATINGNVYIEEGVTIMEGASIKGPCYIGKNAYVGSNAVVRNNTVIEENAVVGSYMEMKNVLLMKNSTTHTGVIEDSIIGRDCRIAAGMITANVRLDRDNILSIVKEEKVDTGRKTFGILLGNNGNLAVRITTMPGVIIGNDVIIGPSTTVMKNIKSHTKYFTKFTDTVEEIKKDA